jgi:hypothetical protein
MNHRHLFTWPVVALVGFISSGTAHVAESASPTPTRCIARWHQPVEDCRLQEPLRVEALGRDEAQARGLAMDRLVTAMDAMRESHALGAPNIMRAVVMNATRACEDHLAAEAVVTCFPEPHLRDARYCRVALPVAQCGSGNGFAVEGRAWRDGERARADLCGSMAEGLDYLAEDPQAVKACESQCWQTSRLECGLL